MKPLCFSVFADLHYKQGMYATTVADLNAVLARAHRDDAEIVLHAGDFCNDYPHSPEILAPYLNNEFDLPVYGCYGNHELETAGTPMTFVTPCLTNRAVIWGTADGARGDGSIAYYYFDHKDYRFVFTDTNYSLRPDGTWEHNLTGSHCPARENSCWNSLGPDQLAWLEQTLSDAAAKELHCIVVSHVALADRRGASPDAKQVRELFRRINAKRPKTVFLAINGHHHTDSLQVAEGVIYFDVNATRNAWWQPTDHNRYGEDAPTFDYIEYDDEGTPLGAAVKRPLRSLRQGNHTLFTVDPLSACVKITAEGKLEICGTVSAWVADVAPDTSAPEVVPAIRSYTQKI